MSQVTLDDSTVHVFEGLQPFTNYTVYVVAFDGKLSNNSQVLQVQTLEEGTRALFIREEKQIQPSMTFKKSYLYI